MREEEVVEAGDEERVAEAEEDGGDGGVEGGGDEGLFHGGGPWGWWFLMRFLAALGMMAENRQRQEQVNKATARCTGKSMSHGREAAAAAMGVA